MNTIDQVRIAQAVSSSSSGFTASIRTREEPDRVIRCFKEAIPTRMHSCALFIRKVHVIDFTYILTLQLIVAIFARLFYQPTLHPETLQTLAQRRRAREIRQMKLDLNDKKVTCSFCEAGARYVNELIPHLISNKMLAYPQHTENLFYYRMGTIFPYGLGYLVRYANYQLDKNTNYRAHFIASTFARFLESGYSACRTNLAHSLFDKSVVSHWVDFEHLFLNICKTAESTCPATSKIQKLIEDALHSLGLTLSKQAEVDEFINSLKLDPNSEDAFIARLEWFKSRKMLPPGLPDPSVERLTRYNLHEKLDAALYQYLEGLMEKLLAHYTPDTFKSGLQQFVYKLEGKDLAKEIMTFIAAEYGLKQLVDPHLFSLAILNTYESETTDLELDGFGLDSKDKIVASGRAMLQQSQKPNASHHAILAEFEKSGLKHTPSNTQGILQKIKTKERLTRLISQMIYSFKEEQHRHPESPLKTIREKASRLPVVGYATLSLHALISGSYFSWNYYTRDPKQDNSSFMEWMAKNFLGENLCDFLAERIVSLIYHPTWRISFLHLLDTLVRSLTEPEPKLAIPQEMSPKENFKRITSFLFDQLCKDNALFKTSIAPWAKHFTGESAFTLFQQYCRPTQGALLERALAPLIPTTKELLLYTRLTDAFRMKWVHFAGDAKFWECFIREYLDRQVSRIHYPLTSERIAKRQELVDTLLTLDPNQLSQALLSTPKTIDEEWHPISIT